MKKRVLIVEDNVVNRQLLCKLLESDYEIIEVKEEKDSLTGIYNTDFFYQKAAEIVRNHPKRSYDIISVDIDRFKVVNELFGMETGDELLKYVAKLLQEESTEAEACGRIGGDIFAVLRTHQESYSKDAFDRFVAKVNEFPIHTKLSLRFGIYPIDETTLPMNVICDRAVMAADSIKGKYDVCHAYYNDTMRQRLLAEQAITDYMQTALDEEQFLVYYQPKYELATERIAGAEALVRWIHPTEGFLSPGKFIPLFEKNGFITQLDRYVWEHACRQQQEWIKNGSKPVAISVNVSRADIYIPELPDILEDMVHRHGLQPGYLHLEITESAYTENPEQLIEMLDELKKRGFVIEMDDFGTGYSSLNMLSELPVDILKLDMGFIKNEVHSDEAKDIMSFIVFLAKWLKLPVVAEGVETDEQIQFLRSMECDYVQGFYYAKPMDGEEFLRLLTDSEITGM